MTPPRQTLNDPITPRTTGPGEDLNGSGGEAVDAPLQRASVDDPDHRSSHTVTAAAKMTGDRTPPVMGTTTMSLTDRDLRLSNDEVPAVRSRRRWALPAAGAVLLLAAGAVAGFSLLGSDGEPAPTVRTSAGPSAQEIQAAKDAAWTSVQTWQHLAAQASQVNSFAGIDATSVALPSAIQTRQQLIDSAIAAEVHFDGDSTLSLLSSEYNAANPGAFAPARVQMAVCLNSSAVRVLDATGTNVRVGPDGSTNYATRLIVNFWVYETDGAWLADSGQDTQDPC